jgi:hypothetical protein
MTLKTLTENSNQTLNTVQGTDPLLGPSLKTSKELLEKNQRLAAEKVPMVIGDFKCPKCSVKTSANATECMQCGLLFAKYRPIFEEGIPGEIRLEGRRDLADLWAAVLTDYSDESKHHQFIFACDEAGCLPYASQKYARVLVAVPHEDVAKRMRRQIIALATSKAESGGATGLWSFRIPGFNSLAIVLGSAAMTMGFILPGMKNLTGIGASMLALSIAVRFFLRPTGSSNSRI